MTGVAGPMVPGGVPSNLPYAPSTGIAESAVTNLVTDLAAKAPLISTGTASAPTTGTWQTGSVATDTSGREWVCVTGGTPGFWALAQPVSIASMSGLLMWLESDLLTGFTNGQSITTWTDSSGLGNSPTQATSGKRPTYATNVWNGKPAVNFASASSQGLATASYPLTGNDFTVFAVFKTSAGSASHWYNGAGLVNCEMPGVANDWGTAIISGGTIAAGGRSDEVFSTSSKGGNVADGFPHTVCLRRTKATGAWQLRIDGATAAYLTGGTTNTLTAPTGIAIGQDLTPGAYLNGSMFAVLIFDRALTLDEITQVESYLSKYTMGTWPAPPSGYLFAGYSQNSATVTNDLLLFTSPDGRANWQQIPLVITPLGGDSAIRDPSIFYDTTNSKWRVACTNSSGATTTVTLYESTDLKTWTRTGTVDLSGVAGAVYAWAPEWFIDSDASVHLLVSVSTTNTTGSSFTTYETNPTNAAYTTWSAPSAVGGAPTGFDAFIIKIGSTYHYVNAVMKHYTSSSPFTGYSAATDIAKPLGGDYSEGPCIVRLPGNIWRIYVDHPATGPASTSRFMAYAETSDPTLNSGWSLYEPLTFLPTPDGAIDHGTVVALV